jgi:hypothetical protein
VALTAGSAEKIRKVLNVNAQCERYGGHDGGWVVRVNDVSGEQAQSREEEAFNA